MLIYSFFDPGLFMRKSDVTFAPRNFPPDPIFLMKVWGKKANPNKSRLGEFPIKNNSEGKYASIFQKAMGMADPGPPVNILPHMGDPDNTYLSTPPNYPFFHVNLIKTRRPRTTQAGFTGPENLESKNVCQQPRSTLKKSPGRTLRLKKI